MGAGAAYVPPGVGGVGDYFNQSGGAADVPGPLSGQYDQFGNMVGSSAAAGDSTGAVITDAAVGMETIAPATGPAAPFVFAAGALMQIGYALANMFGGGVAASTVTNGVADYFATSADWRDQEVSRYLAYMQSIGRQYSSPAIPGANYGAFIGLLQALFGPLQNSGEVLHITVPGKSNPVTVAIPPAGGDLEKSFHDAMGATLPAMNAEGNLFLLRFLGASGHLLPNAGKKLVAARGQAIAKIIDDLITAGNYAGVFPFLRNAWKVSTSDLTSAEAGSHFSASRSLGDLCPCGTCDPTETTAAWNESDPYGDPVTDAANAIEQNSQMAAGLTNPLGTSGGAFGVPATAGSANTNTVTGGPVTVTIDEIPAASSAGLTTTDWILIAAGFLALIMVIKQ